MVFIFIFYNDSYSIFWFSKSTAKGFWKLYPLNSWKSQNSIRAYIECGEERDRGGEKLLSGENSLNLMDDASKKLLVLESGDAEVKEHPLGAWGVFFTKG